MATLPYLPFDADNHYYEAEDAFTRHVPKAMRPRCVQWCEIDGRKHHLVGGRLARAVANPTWNPIAKPGAIADIVLIDLDEPWIAAKDGFVSRSKNTPFEDGRFTGRAVQTYVAGKRVHSAR